MSSSYVCLFIWYLPLTLRGCFTGFWMNVEMLASWLKVCLERQWETPGWNDQSNLLCSPTSSFYVHLRVDHPPWRVLVCRAWSRDQTRAARLTSLYPGGWRPCLIKIRWSYPPCKEVEVVFLGTRLNCLHFFLNQPEQFTSRIRRAWWEYSCTNHVIDRWVCDSLLRSLEFFRRIFLQIH